MEGTNDFGTKGYGGPCPPSGVHQYRLRVYALDVLLSIPSGARRSDIESAVAGHVLSEGILTGTYGR